MHARSTFLLLLGLILAAGSAVAAPSTRFFEIFSQRFITDTSGQPILDLGRFTAQGEFKHYTYSQLSAGTTIPAAAMNKNLLPYYMFPAYLVFEPDGLANFRIDSSVNVLGQDYFVMAVGASPKLDIGTVANFSARSTVTPGGDPLIGGFVIEDHPRRVLVRGVGPTLSAYGVGTPLANPVLTLFRSGEPAGFATNDDWGQQASASDIEAAAASVGAFALPRTSKDAALLIELPPGAYTAQASGRDSAAGTALLEIYVLP